MATNGLFLGLGEREEVSRCVRTKSDNTTRFMHLLHANDVTEAMIRNMIQLWSKDTILAFLGTNMAFITLCQNAVLGLKSASVDDFTQADVVSSLRQCWVSGLSLLKFNFKQLFFMKLRSQHRGELLRVTLVYFHRAEQAAEPCCTITAVHQTLNVLWNCLGPLTTSTEIGKHECIWGRRERELL